MKRILIFCISIAAVVAIGWGILSRSNDKSAMLRSLLDEGEEHFEKDKIYDALICIQRVIAETEDGHFAKERFEALVFMSNIYCIAEDNVKGEELLKNLPFREDCKKESFAPQYYYRLKGYYAAKLHNDYATAQQMGDSAISVATRLYPEKPYYATLDRANLAETYLLWGKRDKAWEIIHQLETDPNFKREVIRSQVFRVRASLFYEECRYDSAYHYAQMGLEMAERTGAVDNIQNCLLMLCKMDSLSNNLSTYIKHHLAYDKATNDYSAQELEFKATSTRALMQAEMYQNKMEDNHTISLLVIAILIILTIGLGGAILFTRRNFRAKQAIDELERKHIEDENLKAKMQNELLNLKLDQEKDALLGARQDNLLLSSRLVEKEESKVHHNTNESDNPSTLELLERQLNEQALDFLTRMSHRHPELTNNDIRLLGFIRLGIKPSIIASALNITPTSLNTARYRLRKKLNLSNDIDLREYLLGI